MKISAAQVKELRDKTGAGMMACKEALVEAEGDLPTAETILQKKGQDRADNRSERETREGIIAIRECTSDGFQGVLLVEALCETDFVARNEEFIAFAQEVLELTSPFDFRLRPDLYEERRALLSAKMGENIQVGGLNGFNCSEPIVMGTYLHSDRRIGAAVALEEGSEEGETKDDARAGEIKGIARDIAMHVVAMKPPYNNEGQMPVSKVNAQREIFLAQVKESGKPEKLWTIIVDGKIRKWVKGQVLLTQPFVKDTSLTVGEYLKEKGVWLRSCSWLGLNRV